MTVPPARVPLDWTAIAEASATLRDEYLEPAGVPAWLERWSDLEKDIVETYTLLKRAAYQHTDDAAAEEAYNAFVMGFSSTHNSLERELIDKLFAVPNLQPPPCTGVPLRALARHDCPLSRGEHPTPAGD